LPGALAGLDEGAAQIVAADDAHLVGNAALLGIAQGGGHAGIGHRHDDVGVHAPFAGQAPAHFLADLIDRTAVHDRVGTREIDIFEQAGASGARGEGFDRFDAVLVDDHDLAVFDVVNRFALALHDPSKFDV